MTRVDLPSGAWAEFGPAHAITERSRRPIRTAMASFSSEAKAAMAAASDDSESVLSPDFFTPADQELMFHINDLVAAALIVKASFLADGRRCTVDDVQDLPAADYDALVFAVGPMVGSVMSGVDFDPTPAGVESPTAPSSE